MKKIIALVLGFAVLASCGTARKIQRAEQKAQIDSATTTKETERSIDKYIDTTRSQHGKVTITEIEFYRIPDAKDIPPVKDRDKNRFSESFRRADSLFDATHEANVELQNVGNIKGAVKSIRQTVIESDVEQKGESKETGESKESESSANVARNEAGIQEKQEPPPDPYRWRYIFYISLVGVAVLLYLKRTPIMNWIKKILAGIRKVL
ncbi:MAG: hypothetical protein IAC06_06035 [Bacteroidetes bacterium]|uniref:Lipoprotein n=1 Tax=Candidatus Cryptobacteroides intestinavium TaxID=2840766 RepID=A0A9D9EZC8_9BACT|nr:hypothetical protein [Candidatus Cryptobacteroides intestinavium]